MSGCNTTIHRTENNAVVAEVVGLSLFHYIRCGAVRFPSGAFFGTAARKNSISTLLIIEWRDDRLFVVWHSYPPPGRVLRENKTRFGLFKRLTPACCAGGRRDRHALRRLAASFFETCSLVCCFFLCFLFIFSVHLAFAEAPDGNWRARRLATPDDAARSLNPRGAREQKRVKFSWKKVNAPTGFYCCAIIRKFLHAPAVAIRPREEKV